MAHTSRSRPRPAAAAEPATPDQKATPGRKATPDRKSGRKAAAGRKGPEAPSPARGGRRRRSGGPAAAPTPATPPPASVRYAATVEVPLATVATGEQADAAFEALRRAHGAVSTDLAKPSITLTFDVTAADARQAAQRADTTAGHALRAAGLGAAGPTLALAVLTAAEQERANAAPLQLLGVSEIAALLQVSRQRVDQLRARPDFPTPAARLKAGPIWTTDALTDFLTTRTTRRPLTSPR